MKRVAAIPPWPASAAAAGLASCHICDLVSPLSGGDCPRCGSHLHARRTEGIQRPLALLLASIVAYVPANLMPIMTVNELGSGETQSTIIGGVVTFWQSGAYPVATVIFVASVIIPILKMLALAWLCAAAGGVVRIDAKRLTKMYRITELVGRWSMVDVFVVAVMVTLIQLGSLMSIHPGPAALAFALVVVLTMFAAMAFEPRLIWDRANAAKKQLREGPGEEE